MRYLGWRVTTMVDKVEINELKKQFSGKPLPVLGDMAMREVVDAFALDLPSGVLLIPMKDVVVAVRDAFSQRPIERSIPPASWRPEPPQENGGVLI
jgi:hypothetical protein